MPKHARAPRARPMDLRASASSVPLIGIPTIRIRPGRSGLDPMDTYREEGAVLGRALRDVVWGKVRTRNPLIMVSMLIGGIILIGPVLDLAMGVAWFNLPSPLFDFSRWFLDVSLALLGAGLVRSAIASAGRAYNPFSARRRRAANLER